MANLLDYSKKELEDLVVSLGEPKFRAKQLYDAVLSGKREYDENNLPKTLLEKLASHDYKFQPLYIYKKVASDDKTTKFLYKLNDANIVEGVLMKYKYGNTLCISTQVGCRMNCAFCASSLNGLVRNLTAGEILGQIVAVNKLIGGSKKDRAINNIVLMGSGEPLDNFDNVTKFLRLVTSEDGLNISVRNISLSTCGIPKKIEKLADMGLNITLCLSLHASNDEIRQKIMPVANAYPIHELMEAIDYYNTVTSRRVIIEYVLIDKVNCNVGNAKELSILLQGKQVHVNLIRLNAVPERGLKGCSEPQSKAFLSVLSRNGISATIRRTTGDDVGGACGQLRNSELKSEENKTSKNNNIGKVFWQKKEII